MHRPDRRTRGRLLPGAWTAVLTLVASGALLASTGAPDRSAEPMAAAAAADGGGSLDPGQPAGVEPVPPAEPPAPPEPPAPADPGPDRIGPPTRLSPEGWPVAGGRSPVSGSSGPTVTYTVEVATDDGPSLGAFTATVVATLADPQQGWTSSGRVRLQRIDDPEVARIRVLLAGPQMVDELCERAGLDTIGRYSCWNGTFAALNVERWTEGVPHVPDLGLYRTYLVNHEFGHGLGYGHESCPGPGELAPLMMQLSVATDGCIPNGVPYP